MGGVLHSSCTSILGFVAVFFMFSTDGKKAWANPDETSEKQPSEAESDSKELEESESRLSDKPIELQPIPEAPHLLIEWPDKFLKLGELNRGVELPTGAIWRPSLWMWGTYRTAVQIFNNRRGRPSEVSEWAQRLDVFWQLNLSGTERLVLGLRPFDEEHRAGPRDYTSYDIREDDFNDAWNADISTFFFEGDIGEIFPSLDPADTGFLDFGFSVGRQPLTIQDGLLIAETSIEAATLTRNTLFGGGILNLRATGMVAWDEINRNDNTLDHDTNLIGLFTETDLSFATVNVDVVYVDSNTDQDRSFHLGASSIQRIHAFDHTFNTSFHVLGSIPTDGDPSPVAENGVLLFSQISHTPHHTHDLAYLNAFWAIDDFTSASRSPDFGGPLGLTGITFAAAGLGRFGAPLSNQASQAFGGGVGYQFVFDDTRQQLIVELGARKDTNRIDEGEAALAARYQVALWQHFILRLDGFVGAREGVDDPTGGARAEILVKF